MRSWMLAAVAAVALVSVAPPAGALTPSVDADAISAASRHHRHVAHHWRARTTTGFSGSRISQPYNARSTGSQAYDAQQGLGGKFGGR